MSYVVFHWAKTVNEEQSKQNNFYIRVKAYASVLKCYYFQKLRIQENSAAETGLKEETS